MSGHTLQTHTERCRDQARIDALEAELAQARQQIRTLASAYRDALEALARACEWRSEALLWALGSGFATVVLLHGLAP
jgi:hypothetical protein